jgi:hypothetical protein
MHTDKHRFLGDKTDDFFRFYLYQAVFIRVHLCKSVVKSSSLFRVPFVFVRG